MAGSLNQITYDQNVKQQLAFDPKNRHVYLFKIGNDYQVIKLQRVRVMHITLDKLKLGEWRNLSEDELSKLLELVK